MELSGVDGRSRAADRRGHHLRLLLRARPGAASSVAPSPTPSCAATRGSRSSAIVCGATASRSRPGYRRQGRSASIARRGPSSASRPKASSTSAASIGRRCRARPSTSGLPLAIDLDDGGLRGSHFCNAIARVRAGVTDAQVARRAADGMATPTRQRYPAVRRRGARASSRCSSEVTGRSRQIVWLLIAARRRWCCSSPAPTSPACRWRAPSSRRSELSLRRALGANRWQLVRVGLAENLLIGVAGAALGLLLAGAGLPLLRQLLPADFPRAHEIALTPQAALFAVAVAMADRARRRAAAVASGATPCRRRNSASPPAASRAGCGRRWSSARLRWPACCAPARCSCCAATRRLARAITASAPRAR